MTPPKSLLQTYINSEKNTEKESEHHKILH